MKTINFNINHQVKVKLTPAGKKHLKMRHIDFWYGRKYPIPKFEIKETRAGWSTWQLWALMAAFGSELGSVISPLMFETTIKLIKNQTIPHKPKQ